MGTEIEGVISEIEWVNPHVRFKVVVNNGGEEEIWNIAGASVSNLSRMDVTRDILAVGDKVRMAGHKSRRADRGLYLSHLLLPDGREAVFSLSAPKRWTGERVGGNEKILGAVEETDVAVRPTSIFAVWTTLFRDPESRTLQPRNTSDYPLSEHGLKAIAAYNAATDSPFGNCAPKGSPAIMDAPYPMELLDRGATILLQLEEYDTVRTIHLEDVHDDREIESSLLGYSTGRWQGDTLVVTTTQIDYPYLHVSSVPSYIPQSDSIRLQETFRLGESRDKLYYTLTVTDTVMLSKPMVLSKFYQWRAGETLQPYKCDEG